MRFRRRGHRRGRSCSSSQARAMLPAQVAISPRNWRREGSWWRGLRHCVVPNVSSITINFNCCETDDDGKITGRDGWNSERGIDEGHSSTGN